MKLAGSTWGASAWSSALALCYSAAEYCAPVWPRSTHTSQVDVQLNSTMRLISGTLCSTPLPWLPVLSNIEPPALRRKAATDNKLVEKIVKHDSWPIQPDILSPPLLRHPGSHCGWMCNQLTSRVDGGIPGSRLRWSILTKCATHNPATGFQPPSATVVSAEPFSHGTQTLRCLQKEMATYRH